VGDQRRFHYIAGQHLGFFDARGFFVNPSDADAKEDVALEDVKRSRDPISHPVGFLTEPVEVARFRRVLLTFGTNLVRSFPGNRPHVLILRLGRMELRSPEFARREHTGFAGSGRDQGHGDRFCKRGRTEEALRHPHSSIRLHAGLSFPDRLALYSFDFRAGEQPAHVNLFLSGGRDFASFRLLRRAAGRLAGDQ